MILEPTSSKFWIKNEEDFSQNISQSFLFINKITENNFGHYQCLSSNENLHINLTKSQFPSDKTSNLHIEFLSSIKQFKLGGNILLNCSSSDHTPVEWLETKQINGIIRNNSYLSIKKFSPKHFNYYYCKNSNTQKFIRLSPDLFQLIENENPKKNKFNKYNTSFIEVIQGKFIGDNITLICRIGGGKYPVFY